MLTEAAIPMGFNVVVEGSAGPNSPAAQVGARQIEGALTDGEAIRRLANETDVQTIEIEHVNVQTLKDLADEGYDVHPSPYSLEIIVDKLTQKQHYEDNELATPPFVQLDNADDLANARDEFGDLIVKARTGGYDGRGNLRVKPDMSWEQVQAELADKEGNTPPLYAEKIVPFQRELSVIGARDRVGNIKLYPVVQTEHADNICNIVIAPAQIDPRVQRAAEELGHAVIETFDGAGVFAVEMFQDEDDDVLVNETAPRVHNSGHYSIEGAETSQFEQHIRAIVGDELGSTDMTAKSAVMINVLGTKDGDFDEAAFMKLAAPNIFPHSYGKSLRPKRKVAHITVLGDDPQENYDLAIQLRKQIAA
jgi:5-(carboxyamino)imidazole ribonucleotide synthase